MRLHHYSSFSLAHSYSEREGKVYSMDYWLAEPIAKEELQKAKMPISDGYFEDAFGRPVARVPFEYIQDHLGYRLELQTAGFSRKLGVGAELAVEIDFVNRGFSTPHNRRPACLVLVDVDGKVTELPLPESDPRQWQPFAPLDEAYKPLVHQIRFTGRLPSAIQPGWYQIGLWMPDADARLRLDPRYAVRVANRDVPWWTDARGQYGVNVLGTLEVVP
jgi:hypothetical protein